MAQFIQNNFSYGEVGERLIANRKSEIYINSAKTIKNMLITDLGTLKVAKQFKSKELNISGTVRRVLDIKDDKYIILTSTHLYQLNKSDDSILHNIEHNMGEDVDNSLISRELIILFNTKTPTNFKVYKLEDMSEKTDYKFRNPIKDREKLEIDLWRVSKNPVDNNKFRVVKMATLIEPKIKVKDNNMYLNNSEVRINRIYVDYNAIVDENYFSSLADGEIYGVMRIFHKVENNKQYILDNTKVEIGSLSDDSKYKGKYFTQIVAPSELDGEFTFGEFLDIGQPTYVSFYQDRTIFYVNNYMYFSKVRDYFNFRNSIESDAPFYIQLNPINNSIGNLLGMIASTGLYILTTAGIYVIGYNNYLLTPQSISGGTLVMSDMGVSNVYDVLDNVVYFMNNNNVLKSITLDSTSLQLGFITHTVDKYSTKNKFKDITKISIEDKDYIMVRSLDDKTMYLIESLGTGLFRTTSLDFAFEGKAFGISDRFIINNKVYSLTDNNYAKATVQLNPPPINGNNILMDNSSSITSVAIKLINEDREAVKGVTIEDTRVRNLSPNVKDRFNIYKIKSKLDIGEGLKVEIMTNENNKVCEFQAIQMDITAIEDK